MIAGRPVHQALADLVPQLARQMAEIFASSLPAFSEMPRDELEQDVVRINEQNLRVGVRLLRDRASASDQDLRIPALAAARLAEEGVPLEQLLDSYQLGSLLVFDTFTKDAEPGDSADLLEAVGIMFRFLAALTSAVGAAYMTERQSMATQQQYAHQTVLSALLAGDDPREPAHRAGIRLPALYLVLSLAIGTNPDEVQPGTMARIATRRKLRRVLAELNRDASGPVLSVLDGAGGVALVPLDDDGWSWEGASGLADRLHAAAGAPVTIAADVTEPGDVAEHAELTRDVLEVVCAIGRPPGLHRIEDVMLEYQITRPGRGRTALARLLEPLEDHPDLIQTLRVYLDHGQDRRATARNVHVHPNTIDYRFRRITKLTGLNPAVPADLQRLSAALLAQQSFGQWPARP